LYKRSKGGADVWGLLKKLSSSTTSASDQLGFVVRLDGDDLAVAAPYYGNTGSVLVYQ
jgi:hypothetical protein